MRQRQTTTTETRIRLLVTTEEVREVIAYRIPSGSWRVIGCTVDDGDLWVEIAGEKEEVRASSSRLVYKPTDEEVEGGGWWADSSAPPLEEVVEVEGEIEEGWEEVHEGEDWITAREAAVRLGRSPELVLSAGRRGDIRRRKYKRRFYFLATEVETLRPKRWSKWDGRVTDDLVRRVGRRLSRNQASSPVRVDEVSRWLLARFGPIGGVASLVLAACVSLSRRRIAIKVSDGSDGAFRFLQ
jgi:hypothetical protein